MSTITHIETSKGVFCFVHVDKGAENITVFLSSIARGRHVVSYCFGIGLNESYTNITLPKGDWQLVSDKTTDHWTDKEAAEVVECESISLGRFKNYSPFKFGVAYFQTAWPSLQSLMSHHELSKENEYAILRKL